MRISEEDKDWITSLIESGDKLGAVRYIQQTLSLSAEDALSLAEKLEEQTFVANVASHEEGVNVVKLVSTIFTIIGFLLLSLSFIFGFRDYRFTTIAIPVTGKVLKIQSSGKSNGTRMYAPLIGYKIAGTDFEYLSTTTSSNPGYTVGEEVNLLIDPENPGEPVVNSFFDRWFVVAILGGIGLVFSTIGFVTRKFLVTSAT